MGVAQITRKIRAHRYARSSCYASVYVFRCQVRPVDSRGPLRLRFRRSLEARRVVRGRVPRSLGSRPAGFRA